MSTETAPYCYRHPERETHIRCQRCGRPICPDCMNQAAVGFQCPSCVQEGRRTQRAPRTRFGGRPPSDPTLTSKVLIGLNVAVFLLISATGRRGSEWFDRLALFPLGTCEVPGRGYLREASEQVCDASSLVWHDGFATGAVWQAVTTMFTHVDLIHLGFNMLALWFLGPQLEAAVGRLRFLAIYLLSGLAGSTAVVLLSEVDVPTIGASGAIFGLMGALLVLAIKVRADYSQLLVWLGLNVLITVVGRGLISWQGHFGGLVGGVLIALVLAYSPRESRGVWQAVGLAVIAVALLVALVVRALTLA